MLAAELAARKPDVFATAATPPTLAAKAAAPQVPLVFIGIADAIGPGLVTSLARPSGNATGTLSITGEIAGKLIELMRELVPNLRRAAFLTDVSSKAALLSYDKARDSARGKGIDVQLMDGRTLDALEKSFASIGRLKIQAIALGAPALLLEHRARIVEFAARVRLPAIYSRREYGDAGGLASYGPNAQTYYRRAAEYVHRILLGAKPADLPVERPTELQLVLNMKTARALGINIPDAVRVRADEVIE